MSGWQRVGGVDFEALAAARIATHWAVQPLAAAARRLIAAREDDGHTSLHWNDEYRALLGSRLPSGRRLGMRLTDFSILELDENADAIAAFPLDGRSLDEVHRWINVPFELPEYDLPDHPVRSGGTFARPDAESLNELTRWFANAELVLMETAGKDPRAAPVAVWPHHFDTGGIIYLEDAIESGPQIGFGLAPGDAHYQDPYFYVTPWPLRDDSEAPQLRSGHWTTTGFTGAVLTGSEIVELDSATEQQQLARGFLADALRCGEDLVDRSRG